MQLNRRNMVRAAQDINRVIQLDPPLNVEGTVKEIREELEEALDFVKPADKLKKSTREVLDHLQEDPGEPEKEDPVKQDPTPEPTVEQEPEPAKPAGDKKVPFSKYLSALFQDLGGRTLKDLVEVAQKEATRRGMKTKMTPGRLRYYARKQDIDLDEVLKDASGETGTEDQPDKVDPKSDPESESSETSEVSGDAAKEFSKLQDQALTLVEGLRLWKQKHLSSE